MLFPLVLLTLIAQVWCKEQVPVIIWGSYDKDESEGSISALTQLRSYKFSELLHKLINQRPHILLFIEENLSVEDFSWEDDRDSMSFPNLHNISQTSKDFLYLPSVESPLSVFHQLSHHGYALINYDAESPPPLSAPRIFKVSLPEPSLTDTRPTMLRSHDKFIAHVAQEAISKYKKVLVAYTGRHASFIEPGTLRHRRDVNDENKEDTEEIIMKDNDKTVFLVVEAPIELYRGENVTFLTFVTFTSIDLKGDTLTLDVKFREEAISLDFTFNAAEGSEWTLDYVIVEESSVKMKSKTYIGGPDGYSFFCAGNTTFLGQSQSGEEYILILKNLQAQPRVTDYDFGPASDCIPYFTSEIWSVLMVTSVLTMVALISIVFILDINTNDKFDDPKGKILSISNE